MQNYDNLQKLYRLSEINEHCVDIDFCYAFICAMASSELSLEQWMPLLFVEGKEHFSDEKVASDFAQSVLAIYQQANANFLEDEPLKLTCDMSCSAIHDAINNFAKGYLHALMMIDNLQMSSFVESSAEANLQQTCLLLLDKLANPDTQDVQKLAIFEQLPSHDEIVELLPTLLSRYGHICLSVDNDE